MEATLLAGFVQNEVAIYFQSSQNSSLTQKEPSTTGDPKVCNLEHPSALEGMNSRDVVLASTGFRQFEAFASPQHIMGPSQPLHLGLRALNQ